MKIIKQGEYQNLGGTCNLCNCEIKTNTLEADFMSSKKQWYIKCPYCGKNDILLRRLANFQL